MGPACLNMVWISAALFCALVIAQHVGAQSADAIPKPAPAPAVSGNDSRHYPPPLPPIDQARLGIGVQRTMTLLATSTAQHRHRVRILVYGQSISEQKWWKLLKENLQERFPDADLDMENRAIGGFSSPRLVKSAEFDLYPFYPDLTIFHVYGPNNYYEDIVRKLRSTTTSEMLMQTDHATGWPDPEAKEPAALWWDHMMNDVYLPQIAGKYGCGLCDVRGEWVSYLKHNHLQPRQLTADGTHLNGQGCYLMAQIISRHLVYRPELPDDGWRNSVIDRQVGQDVNWNNGRILLEFEGNRIDALARVGGSAGTATVLIDGRKPSEFPGCCYAARPSPGPWSPLFIARIDHAAPLLVESWTYKVTSVASDGASWHFDVSGSVTGPDGSGVSSEPFTSRSGRVKLEPEDYFRGFDPATSKLLPLPVGFESKWEVLPLFKDTYDAVPNDDPATDHLTTLAQGLPGGKHVLELRANRGGTLPIKAFRIYRPPYEEANLK